MAEFELAIETFARGYAFTRSFTHPCLAERVGPAWVVRDAPRRRGDYRCESWIVSDTSPAEVHRLARAHTRGHYSICAIRRAGEDDAEMRREFKALRYRLGTTEALMVHDLKRIPNCPSPARIVRVMREDEAQQLAKRAGSRQILSAHLKEHAPLRQYAAFVDSVLVGWVRSLLVSEATWCSNMYVVPDFRRRGIARAMLCQMLRDGRKLGASSAILLASHTGAMLYPVVGYRQIGTLYLCTPQRVGALRDWRSVPLPDDAR